MTKKILKVPFDVFFNKNLSLLDKQIYSIIYDKKDDDGFCYATTSEIAVTVKVHTRTVSRSIKHLEELGLIAREITDRNSRTILVD